MGIVILGYADISHITAADVMLRLHEVSPQRRQKILANKTDKGIRQSFGAGKLLETMLLRRGIALDFYSGDSGKPYVAGDIFFNLSHCREMVFCGLHGSEIGCDAEMITEIRRSVFEHAFSPEEKAYIADDAERFYRLWTIKESYVKYLGQTVALIKNAGIEVATDGGFKIKGADVNIITGKIDNYIYSVCGKGIISVDLENYEQLFVR